MASPFVSCRMAATAPGPAQPSPKRRRVDPEPDFEQHKQRIWHAVAGYFNKSEYWVEIVLKHEGLWDAFCQVRDPLDLIPPDELEVSLKVAAQRLTQLQRPVLTERPDL